MHGRPHGRDRGSPPGPARWGALPDLAPMRKTRLSGPPAPPVTTPALSAAAWRRRGAPDGQRPVRATAPPLEHAHVWGRTPRTGHRALPAPRNLPPPWARSPPQLAGRYETCIRAAQVRHRRRESRTPPARGSAHASDHAAGGTQPFSVASLPRLPAWPEFVSSYQPIAGRVSAGSATSRARTVVMGPSNALRRSSSLSDGISWCDRAADRADHYLYLA